MHNYVILSMTATIVMMRASMEQKKNHDLRFLSTCTLSGKIPEVKENVNLHKTCEFWKKLYRLEIGDWCVRQRFCPTDSTEDFLLGNG